MYKYKAVLPTPDRDVIEFESRLHISMLNPVLTEYDNYFIYFQDAQVGLNLATIEELEINGQKYKIRPYKLQSNKPHPYVN